MRVECTDALGASVAHCCAFSVVLQRKIISQDASDSPHRLVPLRMGEAPFPPLWRSQRVAALAIHPVLHTTDTAAHAFDTRNHCKVLLLEPPRHSVARGSLGNSQESGDLRYREPALFADFRTHHGRLQKSTALP